MKQARLGRLDVARIGFGAMGMSAYYTGAREDDEQSIRDDPPGRSTSA